MHIDAVQVAARVAETALSDSARNSATAKRPESGPSTALEAPVNLPKLRELSVSASFIENQVIVYRFVDKETGDLIRQVPPQELLQVMRNIEDMLNAENTLRQKLDLRS